MPSQLPKSFNFSLALCLLTWGTYAFSKIPHHRHHRSIKTVYGTDDRRDVFEIEDPRVVDLARSTVALFEAANFETIARGKYRVVAESLGHEFNLCAGERFRNQPSAANCSGFLVAPDTIVTAGHCIARGESCSEARIVFDFAYLTSRTEVEVIDERNIYRCKKVKHRRAPEVGADFAVIELDRPVTNREPMSLRRHGRVSAGESVFIIGTPSGIPLKVAGPARVRTSHRASFLTSLDSFAGNSGSPVFNSVTLQVEGVLVDGDEDYRPPAHARCQVVNRCSEEGCNGEDVTTIAQVIPFLN